MAYNETNETAWGSSVGFNIDGTPIGIVKQDSISVETADGTKLEWKAVGGKVIDQLQGEPTVTVKCVVKNLNKSNLEKFWKIEEEGDKIKVLGMTNAAKYAISIGSDVVGAEIFTAPKCAVAMRPKFAENEGWTQEVEFTLLEKNGVLFEISQKQE